MFRVWKNGRLYIIIYISKCWYRINSTLERRGRICWRGFAHGNQGRGLTPYRYFRNHSNFLKTKGQNSWDVLPHPDENPPFIKGSPENGMTSVNSQAMKNFTEPGCSSFQTGFMAKLKFRATVAATDRLSSNHCLIDSGGAHHYFLTEWI